MTSPAASSTAPPIITMRRAASTSSVAPSNAPSDPPAMIALPAKTNGSSRWGSCQAGTAVSAMQHGRVGGDARGDTGRGEARGPGERGQQAGVTAEQPGDGGQPAREVGSRRGVGEGREDREDVRADRHRRGRLDDPQHVGEPLGPTEVVDQADERRGHRRHRAETPDAHEGCPTGGVPERRQRRRPRGETTREQVARDVDPVPGRRLQDLASVVAAEVGLRDHQRLGAAALAPPRRPPGPGSRRPGRHLRLTGRAGRPARTGRSAHRRRPAKAETARPTNVAAARPACFHMAGRSRVVTTGSGGNPYTSGSSSSRKNAPSPPTPSSGSWP